MLALIDAWRGTKLANEACARIGDAFAVSRAPTNDAIVALLLSHEREEAPARASMVLLREMPLRHDVCVIDMKHREVFLVPHDIKPLRDAIKRMLVGHSGDRHSFNEVASGWTPFDA